MSLGPPGENGTASFNEILACHPSLDEEHCAELCEVVSHTLLELVDERPEMAEILSGRTFARTLH